MKGIYYCSIASCKGICITIDDGPNNDNTIKTVNFLKENNIPACFFVIGSKAIDNDNLEYIYKNGFLIGNHTYSHRLLTNLSKEEIEFEIDKCSDIIKKATGTKPLFFRPPYGEANKMIIEISNNLGMKVVNWSIDTCDWKKEINIPQIIDNVKNKIVEGSIILMHDLDSKSVYLIKELFKIVEEKQLEFIGLEEKIRLIDERKGRRD